MKLQQKQWIKRWKTWLAPTRIPGVWKRKEGGHLVRSRITDPTTGRRKELKKVLPEADEATAYKWLCDEREKLRRGLDGAQQPKTRFADYSVSLLERKLMTREIKSSRGRERWVYTLRHLIEGTAGVPGLGDIFVDEIRPRHIEDWRTGVAKLVANGTYMPTTTNGWLFILKHVMKRAKSELQLPFDAAEGIRPFDTSEHETYTEEEPNALTSEETGAFLACMKEACPAQYAMTYLGFAIGLRPSSMRPLRRTGPTPDVLWDEGVILVRRSQTLGDDPMKTTKTGLKQRITVPSEVMDVLRWHVQTQLLTPEQRDSELLFPADDGGFRSDRFLTKAFAQARQLTGIKKNFTPRGMRRTFNDLARLANVEAVVTKSISGHRTDRMREHYSSVQPSEQRESIGRLLRLVKRSEVTPNARDKGCSEGCSATPKGAPAAERIA